MKKATQIVTLLAASALLIVLAGCNTTKGFGEDVEDAGAELKDAADRNGAD